MFYQQWFGNSKPNVSIFPSFYIIDKARCLLIKNNDNTYFYRLKPTNIDPSPMFLPGQQGTITELPNPQLGNAQCLENASWWLIMAMNDEVRTGRFMVADHG